MDINMSVSLGDLKLKNPLMGASGTFGFGYEYEDFLNLEDIGAIVTKCITLNPRAGNEKRRICETPSGMLNAIGLENPGVDYFTQNILPKIVKYNTPIIVNISATSISDFGILAKKLDLPNVSALEVNISCPNVKDGGIIFGTDYELAKKVTKIVKENFKKTVIIKLSPNITNIGEMAKHIEDAGADCLSLINTLTGMAIDAKTKRPILGNITGGLSGPAVKPVALRMVYEVNKAVSIPIIGMGGIQRGTDVVEFMLAGATCCGIGSYNFVNPKALADIKEELHNYLVENNIEDIKSLIGGLIIE